MRDRSCGQDDTVLRRKTRTPSFSSSLLDSICRSIEKEESEAPEPGFYRETEPTVNKQSNGDRRQRDRSLMRAIMRESLMEKQTGPDHNPSTVFSNSGSSSSCSSTLFSSSETESTHRDKISFKFSKPKAVSEDKKPKQDRDRDGFAKTKLRALKIYGELKKVKQPISPGGRISSFLNSIFSSGGGSRKAKMCSAGAVEDVNFECKPKSACSLSRSCINKTGRSPNPKGGEGAKRSVRFYPVSVIVDEDSRACGHKCIYEDDPSLMPTPSPLIKKQSVNGGVEAAAREFLMRTYQKKKSMIEFDDDDDDDAKSCASSDLFELDHLIGKAGRYREELPVYETTSLRTNKAIAGGFIF